MESGTNDVMNSTTCKKNLDNYYFNTQNFFFSRIMYNKFLSRNFVLIELLTEIHWIGCLPCIKINIFLLQNKKKSWKWNFFFANRKKKILELQKQFNQKTILAVFGDVDLDLMSKWVAELLIYYFERLEETVQSRRK